MRRLRYLVLLAALCAGPLARSATIPLFTGPQDPSQLQYSLNTLIGEINAIVNPLTGGPYAPGNNSVSLTPGQTGQPAQIVLQPGADTNAGININPNGSGNISFFGPYDTGYLQINNQVGWTPATGLSACPGFPKSGGSGLGLGPAAVVTGAFPFLDWLGRPHWSIACG